jgi:hypothetical protein
MFHPDDLAEYVAASRIAAGTVPSVGGKVAYWAEVGGCSAAGRVGPDGVHRGLRGKRQGAGRLRYRVRYRDPAGRERTRSFARKVDAERFLRHVEADLVRGQWVDPEHGRMTVGNWPSAGLPPLPP